MAALLTVCWHAYHIVIRDKYFEIYQAEVTAIRLVSPNYTCTPV